MPRCKKQGCRKSARWPSKFCSPHTSGEAVPVTKNVAASKKKEPLMKSGLQCEFQFDNEDVINGITNILVEKTTGMTKDTGHREFNYLSETGNIEPLLQLIVEEAGKETSFPLKKNTRIQEIVVAIAPPAGSRSTPWTRGLIHRDMDSPEVTGIYTFMLCIDEITQDNGALEIWCQSKKSVHQIKHPRRAIEGMVVKTLTGPKNTVFVWDSRLLHQALPNRTCKARTVLIWLVSSKSKPGTTLLA
jgi:hypothetical protein